ncbi:hypothetical protein BTO20_38415 (plasmid) [Mycobacterium dioxanotrophicus]|uniref:Uncharacterized protein n=1 Tax=Mycobacterium dioxanotrophicus TaxID=482462 RepID=A0A1Y0CGV8_9MYCO|nr:sigma factor-like helix-turn-helix DNA-binding protein [Mycobacterium dioxanotrophicus]ART74480.1 hypothetical protein BTO20_38415 [Mycobacterium dioxanotrophicus]
MDDLDAALTRLSDAQQATQDARQTLHAIIRQMIAHGPRGTQAEIAKRTGYTRERIRQIVRDSAPVPENPAKQTPEPLPHSQSEDIQTDTGDLPPPPMATP